MTPLPDDDRLGDLLRSLPRATAPPGFTARVLARLEPRSRRRAFATAALPAAAALALAVLAGAVVQREREEGRRRADRQAIAALEGERAALAEELELLERIAAGEPALLRVGSAAGFDVFVDVNPEPAAETAAAVRLAAAHTVY